MSEIGACGDWCGKCPHYAAGRRLASVGDSGQVFPMSNEARRDKGGAGPPHTGGIALR